MKLINETSTRCMRELAELINFCRKFSKFHNKARIVVKEVSCIAKHGETWKEWPKAEFPDHPTCIHIYLYKNEEYPRRFKYLECLPEVRTSTWQEHFILTVAHELRHVQQMNDGSFDQLLLENRLEIDAEMHGIRVLTAFQAIGR